MIERISFSKMFLETFISMLIYLFEYKFPETLQMAI